MLTARFNATAGDDHAARDRILRELLGGVGEGTVIRPPFRCDYGYQTRIGARTFANFGLIALDVWLGGGVIVCPGVSIGDNTVVGAGAVVTRDLPATVLAVGNPARIVRGL